MSSQPKYLIFIAIICSFYISALLAAPSSRACPGTLRVYLAVSSLVSPQYVRQLEVYWTGATPQVGDWVGIFASDPTGATPLPPSLAVVDPAGFCEGWERTVITEEGRVNSSINLGFERRCLDYYVGYIQGGVSIASSCLQLEPTWMSERPALGNFPLTGIFLPGTHDSGAYGEYNPIIGDTPVTKYTVTQDEDILSQLIHGIRYLDIRVGYYSNESASGFWLNHGAVRMYPMEVITEQVRQFLQNTPSEEIVIFDVQEFTFFDSPEDHDRLVAFFASEFAGYILPNNATNGWTTPISDLWATGGRLILSYDDTSVVSRYPWLWPSVMHMWGNVNRVEDLYTYLEGLHANPPDGSRAWSAMAELTPTTYDVITDRFGGLRPMADSVNRNVTSWYLDLWGGTCNIVAVDFFRGSDIVQVALEWDDKRIQLFNKTKVARSDSSWYSKLVNNVFRRK